MHAPRSRLVRLAQGEAGSVWGSAPDQLDVGLQRRLHRRMSLLFGPKRYFRLQASGWENVPPRNALLVSNHSGGTTLIDGLGLWYLWQERFGFARPAHGLAHEMIFAAEPAGRLLARLGALRADAALAEEVLLRWGRDVLVMPGGDRDVWRPWQQRYRVNFAGRKGYARLAIRSGAPVLPVAHAGAQSSLLVLTDGAPLARLLGLPALARAEIFPVSLALPWGVAVGPWPHLPLPVSLRYRIGAPIQPPRCRPGEDPPPDAVDELDARVQAAIQGLLDELKAESRPRRAIARLTRMAA